MYTRRFDCTRFFVQFFPNVQRFFYSRYKNASTQKPFILNCTYALGRCGGNSWWLWAWIHTKSGNKRKKNPQYNIPWNWVYDQRSTLQIKFFQTHTHTKRYFIEKEHLCCCLTLCVVIFNVIPFEIYDKCVAYVKKKLFEIGVHLRWRNAFYMLYKKSQINATKGFSDLSKRFYSLLFLLHCVCDFT